MENEKIKLTPIDQRYIASCSPLPHKSNYAEAMRWKEILQKSSMADKEKWIPISEFRVPFPKIYVLHKAGVFDDRSVKNYFEGTDREGHNELLYDYAKDAAKRNDPDLPGILAHIEQCSVRIAHIEDNLATVFSYRDNYAINLDKEYLGIHPVTDHVFIHGKSEKGAIVIRGIEDYEAEDMIQWFEELQKSPDNPFLKYKTD
jgi:hypothetical protein